MRRNSNRQRSLRHRFNRRRYCVLDFDRIDDVQGERGADMLLGERECDCRIGRTAGYPAQFGESQQAVRLGVARRQGDGAMQQLPCLLVVILGDAPEMPQRADDAPQVSRLPGGRLWTRECSAA